MDNTPVRKIKTIKLTDRQKLKYQDNYISRLKKELKQSNSKYNNLQKEFHDYKKEINDKLSILKHDAEYKQKHSEEWLNYLKENDRKALVDRNTKLQKENSKLQNGNKNLVNGLVIRDNKINELTRKIDIYEGLDNSFKRSIEFTLEKYIKECFKLKYVFKRIIKPKSKIIIDIYNDAVEFILINHEEYKNHVFKENNIEI